MGECLDARTEMAFLKSLWWTKRKYNRLGPKRPWAFDLPVKDKHYRGVDRNHV